MMDVYNRTLLHFDLNDSVKVYSHLGSHNEIVKDC